MRGLILRILCLSLGAVGVASAANRFVSLSGGHVSPYTNWANAATNLHAVMGVATNNDLITVSNGVFALTSTLTIARSGLVLQSVNGPGATALDGRGRVACLTVSSNNVRLLGLTIQNGSNTANGGAISIGTNRSGIVVSNCVIHGSYAGNDGGGLYFPSSSTGLVTGSTFTRNRGTYGGGLCARGAGLVISNCVFRENGADGGPGTGGAGAFLAASGTVVLCRFERNVSTGNDGGGLLINAGTPTVDRCQFVDNTADDWGGGLASYGGTAVIQNSLFLRNRADEGGAVHFNGGGVLRNNTLVDNRANLLSSSGGGIYLAGGAVENCILYFNSPDNYAVPAALRFTNCCSTPLPPGTANFTNDPELLYRSDDVLWPATNSPCRNAGTNRTWMTGAFDYSGQARIIGGVVDVGAYEVGALVAHLVATPLRGVPPLTVAFTALVTGTNTTGVGRRWDFTNDGAFDTAGLAVPGITNVYTNTGYFTVRLVVTNAIGQSGVLIRTNYIAAQPIRYVAPGGLHVSPFTNWLQAATNVAAALALAGDRGTVLVSNGTYALSGPLVLTGGVQVVGVNGPDVTALVGPATGRLATLEPATLLAGMRLRGGRAPSTGEWANCGGALLVRYGGTASNLVLAGSSSSQAGGAVCLAGGGLLTHSRVESNQAPQGGGVAVFSGGDLVNCRVAGNQAGDAGGGLYIAGNSLVRNTLLLENSAGTNGGGVAIVKSGGTLENCTVLDNTSGVRGGGLYCENAGNVQNTIAVSNSAPTGLNWYTNAGTGGYGFFFAYTCTAPTTGLPNATGCTSNAPDFRAAATNDFRLLPGSAGMDGGATLAWMLTGTDLGDGPRVINGTVDMGAFEAPALLLEITNLVSGARVPFRATRITVAGRGYNLAGQMGYTNATAGQTAISNFTAAANWTAEVRLPARGDYALTVFATNSAGVATQQTVTIERQRSQLFWLEP